MKKGFREGDVARSLRSILLLGGFQNSTKHNEGVGVHSSHSAQRLAHIVGIHAKWHLWLEDDFSFVTGFNEFWFFNLDVAGALSPLPQDLHQLARGFSGSDVDGWSESSLSVGACGFQLSRVVLDENGGSEGVSGFWWIVVTISSLDGHNVSNLGHVFLWKSLNVDTNVVSWSGFVNGLVVHFDGKALSRNTGWGEDDVGARLEGSLFDTAGDDITNTLNLVNT